MNVQSIHGFLGMKPQRDMSLYKHTNFSTASFLLSFYNIGLHSQGQQQTFKHISQIGSCLHQLLRVLDLVTLQALDSLCSSVLCLSILQSQLSRSYNSIIINLHTHSKECHPPGTLMEVSARGLREGQPVRGRKRNISVTLSQVQS